MGNRIEAKNGLENYCYSLKTSISSPEVEGKIPADDKKKLEDAIEESISWLDANQTAEKEEYEEKQKALEGIAMPILQSMAGAGGAPGGMPGGMPGQVECQTLVPQVEQHLVQVLLQQKILPRALLSKRLIKLNSHDLCIAMKKSFVNARYCKIYISLM